MPLIRLQKRALRVIAGVPPRTHTVPLFNLFRMLPINSIYEYSVCTFMYKYSGTIFPAVINDLFIPTSIIHAHNTRSSQLRYYGLGGPHSSLDKNTDLARILIIQIASYK